MGADKKSAQHDRIQKQGISVYRGSLKRQQVNRKLLIQVHIKIESALYLKRNIRLLYIVQKMSGAAARTGEER